MSAGDTTEFGQPKAVDVASIERELSRLWKTASEGGTSTPVLRSCALNLLVYLSGDQTRKATEVIGRLTVRHPNRSIVMVAESDLEPAELTAWVAAHCHLPRGGAKQVCCEQIILNARGQSVAHLPGAAIPFLLPDLPVFLWWTEFSAIENVVFEKLFPVANRVILDSAQFPNPKSQFKRLLSLPFGNGTRAALGDLNWSRLLPWRELTAQFFDSPAALAQLEQIDRVLVEYQGSSRRVSTLPAQPLLLAGWFAGRLGCKPVPYRHHVAGLCHHLVLDRRPREFQMEIRLVGEARGYTGRVTSISLFSSEKPRVRFDIRCAVQDEHGQVSEILEALAQLEDQPVVQRQVALKTMEEDGLLADQLDIPGHDLVYDEALGLASQLTSW